VISWMRAWPPVFAGMLCRIVPFLTWMRAYGPKVGRAPAPAASVFVKPRPSSGVWRCKGL
jgi:hypothetical protein